MYFGLKHDLLAAVILYFFFFFELYLAKEVFLFAESLYQKFGLCQSYGNSWPSASMKHRPDTWGLRNSSFLMPPSCSLSFCLPQYLAQNQPTDSNWEATGAVVSQFGTEHGAEKRTCSESWQHLILVPCEKQPVVPLGLPYLTLFFPLHPSVFRTPGTVRRTVSLDHR